MEAFLLIVIVVLWLVFIIELLSTIHSLRNTRGYTYDLDMDRLLDAIQKDCIEDLERLERLERKTKDE